MDAHPPAARPRARDLGLLLGVMAPGPLNAITDVAEVRVGHVTLFSGDGPAAVRTGVTAILPHGGNLYLDKVPAAVRIVNAFGKMAGTTQIAELGEIETPIVLTNTLQVGTAWNALVIHAMAQNPALGSVNPVVAECNDGWLNDIRGRHVREEHVLQAIEEAAGGPVPEGVVGAGTGMLLYGGWKGGIGTASRRLPAELGAYTVGILVLANFGGAHELTIDGVHVGRRLTPADELPQPTADESGVPSSDQGSAAGDAGTSFGSCIVVVATDAPLSVRQLGRVAQRGQSGLARTGTVSGHSSGEYTLAFTTANRITPLPDRSPRHVKEIAETDATVMDALFGATVEATEESVINALFTADTVVGRDGHTAPGFPAERWLLRYAGNK